MQAQLDDIDVDAPRVRHPDGLKNDMEMMEKAANELVERGICSRCTCCRASQPDAVAEYSQNARMRGIRVIIAGAGNSAALPGAVAAYTDLPVVACRI